MLSLNVGAGDTTGPRGRLTGIRKTPVPQIEVRAPGPPVGGLGSGVLGDVIGDRKAHGGADQAVYAVAREELDAWSAELGRALPDGCFGENLTTAGLDVDAALIGERWQVGPDVVLRVTGPRIPCATFALHMGEERWVDRFAQRGRPGAYLAVERAGTITTGDPITVIERPEHAADIQLVFRALRGDLDAAAAALAAGCLGGEFLQAAEAVLAR